MFAHPHPGLLQREPTLTQKGPASRARASWTSVALTTREIGGADCAVFSARQLGASRTRLCEFGTTNSETVGSQSHSLNQLPLRERSLLFPPPSKGRESLDS